MLHKKKGKKNSKKNKLEKKGGIKWNGLWWIISQKQKKTTKNGNDEILIQIK